jgi:hypothetical protein
MAEQTFSEYLKARNIDESKLSPEERAFAAKMFGVEAQPEAAPIQATKDGAGEELKVGDTVTITYKVTGIHPIIDPESGKHLEDRHDINLSRVLADGSARHTISCPSHWVKKG